MPKLVSDFAGATAELRTHFDVDTESAEHLRLSVPVRGSAAPIPVTAYLGRSSVEAGRTRIHIAAPLLGVARSRSLEVARAMDEMPLGGIRVLGEHLHVHDSLAFPVPQASELKAIVALIAGQAAALTSEFAEAGAGTHAQEGAQ